jgi:crotonobetainyl-CoA:carnitine CoA-transferase CaiB-like acyl-CoA transferase
MTAVTATSLVPHRRPFDKFPTSRPSPQWPDTSEDAMGRTGGAVLEGVRVLDLARAMPASVCTMLLADHGADVLRVELPTEAPAQSVAATRTWARGRRVTSVDPLSPAALSDVHGLADGADVVVTDLEPAAAKQLGLDAPSVRARNDDVVYVALTGFGLDDDRRTPAIDVLVAAELGAMNAATAARRDGPVFLAHPAIAYSTALTATIGTLAALRRRIVAGTGDLVDVSLLDGVLAQQTMNWWTARNVSFLSDRRADGQLDLGRTRMLVRRYTCGDGGVIQVHTGAPGAFARLMRVLGVADRLSPATGPLESACPLTDADIAVLDELPAVFGMRSVDEWLAEIWANDVAALPVLAPAEVFDDDQVRHNGLVRTVEDAELGPIDVVATPITLSASPAITTSADRADGGGWIAPGLDPGRPGPDVDLAHGPLTGVRVVELSSFFASPYANRFLRDLGADVVKVEPLAGDPMRSLPDPFEGVARGKQSLALDLKSDRANAVLDALVRRADIVQHNFRPGAAERLGVDESALRAVNPTIIYQYAPGFGSSGPKSRLQSFAPLQSGFVGVQVEAAGADNVPTLTFGNEDYYNGQLNAIGTLLALLHRDRTGIGQYVECAQLNSSVFVTSHWYRVGGDRRSSLPRLDAMQVGWSPYQRLYQCLEGWLCVCCTDPVHETALVATVLGDSATAGDDVAELLEYGLFGRTAVEWRDVLRDADVPCTVAIEHMWLFDHLLDPDNQACGRATAFDHRVAGPVSVIGQIVRLDSTPPREPVTAPLLGEHSTEVLGELGFTSETIAELLADGVVKAAPHEDGS